MECGAWSVERGVWKVDCGVCCMVSGICVLCGGAVALTVIVDQDPRLLIVHRANGFPKWRSAPVEYHLSSPSPSSKPSSSSPSRSCVCVPCPELKEPGVSEPSACQRCRRCRRCRCGCRMLDHQSTGRSSGLVPRGRHWCGIARTTLERSLTNGRTTRRPSAHQTRATASPA